MSWELLFLLLPIAAASGWMIGRRGVTRRNKENCNLSDEYFKGLNYLLNEQSDKAIEVFIHMVEVDSDTVEIHLALGNLFLRRGEVDRAIRIHQNLIARPNLTASQRQQALYELGRDYMRAGLLDRAESLFRQVGEKGEYAVMALRQLLDVYQMEKEWKKAAEIALRLEKEGDDSGFASMIAHFYCELGDEALRHNASSEASQYANKAIDADPKSVRATMLSAKISAVQGDFRKAIRFLLKIMQQDSSFVAEALPLLSDYFQQLGAENELLDELNTMLESGFKDNEVVILLARLLANRGDEEEARRLLLNHVADAPSLRGVDEVIQYKLRGMKGSDAEEFAVIAQLIHKVLDNRVAYRCRNCGYSTRTLHWQCPRCKGWSSIKPIAEHDY